MNLKRVGVIDFVRRQTKESPYDHFEGTWDELLTLIEGQFDKATAAPSNSGVLIVPMKNEYCHRFFTSVIKVSKDTELQAFYKERSEGEEAFLQIVASNQEKQQAKKVDIILYSHDTLAQDDDAPIPQEAEYYVVSINAYTSDEEAPMGPMTMARNFLNLTGGTKPETPYTAEEFAKSIVYWSQHVRSLRDLS